MAVHPRPLARSLRRRALLPTIAGALLLFATTVALLHAMMTRQLAERILSRSTTVAHMAANAVESDQNPDQVRRTVAALGAEPMIDLIVVTMGSSHNIIATTRPEWADSSLEGVGEHRLAAQIDSSIASRRESGAALHGGDGMSYAVPIQRETPDGRPTRGAVAVIVNGGSLRAQTRDWLWRFGAALLALEALALAAAELCLRRYVLRPIQEIAVAAKRMRGGDRAARAPVLADDELGRLATTLNEAHAGLTASIAELEFQKFALDQSATVLVTDAEGIIQYVNDAYCRLSGYTRDELVGQNPRIVNSGHHAPEHFRQMFEIISSGGVWRGELCNRARDGHPYWVHSTIIPSLDALGQPTRYTAVLYDISERKLAEEEARVADARFRDVANTAPALIWMSNAGGDSTFFNQPWLEFTGRTLEQECGDGWTEGIHPEDRPNCVRIYTNAIALSQPFEMEYRLRRHDGEYRMVLDRGVPRFRDGAFVGYAGSCIDITDRAAAERELRTSEARTRQILDTAIDAVVTVDDAGLITTWNLQAEKVFGWTAEEAVGTPLVETIVPAQYRAAHTRGFARFLRTGEGNVLGNRLEITALRRNGEEFPVELSISAMPVEKGTFFSAFIRDISDRRRTETELVRAKDAAQSASRAKSEFLAMMSHEIRTPMNGVIGFTDLLLDSGLDAGQREYAETIRSSGQSLLALINDILDFSKIEAGKLDVESVPFDARQAAEDTVELLSARARERNINVVFEWPADVPHELVGDAMRFRQVLLNLAGNALKFTQAGAVYVSALRVDAENGEQGRLRMQVRDTGIGIPEDKLANLFRRFSQADSSTTRRFGGTGLGLAISKQLVELMGGAIGADSRPGEGSTFWFTLPLPAASAAIAPAVDDRALAGLRVLVVAGEEAGRSALGSQLTDRGIEAVTVANAEGALVLLRVAAAGGNPFRAAVLEHCPPDADGEALARAILADSATGAPALLLLAPGCGEDEAERFRAQGFADAMAAPGERAELLLRSLARASRRRAPECCHPVANPPAATCTHAEDEPAEPFAPMRVLLAEDHPVNQKLALRVLGKLGCAVDLSENGVDACALAAATEYDLILMDCHMPEMDGFEATAVIRSREAAGRLAGTATRRTPIVALTASVLQEDRDRCMASGMDDFVSKPFRPDELQSVLERWVRREDSGEGPARAAA